MFVSFCLSPSSPKSYDGDKKQADFSCMDARKAVYCPFGRGQAAPRHSSSELGSALGLHCP